MKAKCVFSIIVFCLSGGVADGSDSISPDKHKKSVMLSLVAIAENSQTTLAFSYAENINDGRGITFGIIGFTTGTSDGNEWLHHYTQLNPTNRLTKYIPALVAIDSSPHPNGMSDDISGLSGFVDDFRASLNDAFFRESQLEKMDELYWNPSLSRARSLGIHNFITLAQIFDASIQMGEDGMEDVVAATNSSLGGSPKDGIDEISWLTKFLDIRANLPAWIDTRDRVDMYSRIVKNGNYSLATPFDVTCYGDRFTVTGLGVLP